MNVFVCAEDLLLRQPSANTHFELWFANENWMSNTIQKLCSCHGDVNHKHRPVLSASLNLQNWDARRGLHAELPKWVQAKTIARCWLCQSLRGLLWQLHTLRRTYSQHQKLREYQHQQQECSIFVQPFTDIPAWPRNSESCHSKLRMGKGSTVI